MTRYIVPAEVEKIAREADIAEIIAEYVPLTRSGQSYKGLCPFHSEKTPSFVVSPEKRVFHCFGCGAGGNVFTFIMKWDGVDFPTAVQTIATKIGLSISTDERTTGHKERMYHSAERVCSFYQRMLQRNTTANNYLKQRGLRPEITSVFRLGWAPESRQFLDFCQKSGLPNPLLQKLGLIRQNPEGSSYAYFRRRLIFPVLTWSGKVTGFGARVLDNSTPKYLNSPQSPIFSKGQMLYGLHLAREHIRQSGQAILVEGYMDVIALHQVDIKNAVASLGTALTPSQVTLLKRYANTVTLAFDEDSAGQIATVKGIDLLLEQGLNVRILSLPQGKDPAEAMQHGEKDSFIRQLQSATDYIDYRIKTAVEQNSPLTTQNKLKVIGTLLPTLNRISSRPSLDDAFRKISDAIHLREETLRIEFDKYRKEPRTFSFSATSEYAAPGEPDIEKRLLQVMLQDKQALEVAREHFGLNNFTDATCRAIARELFANPDSDPNPGLLISRLDDSSLDSFVSSLTCTGSLPGGCEPARFARDVISTLKRRSLQRQMKKARLEALASEEQGAQNKTNEYLRQVAHMKRASLTEE